MEKQLEQLSCFINRVASDVRLKPTHTSVYLALCDSGSAKLFQESKKVSLWHRYETAIIMGAISALLTNLLLMMV
jgi:hypothetical protein